MGAVTSSLKRTTYHSAGKIIVADITFSSSYAATTTAETWSLYATTSASSDPCSSPSTAARTH